MARKREGTLGRIWNEKVRYAAERWSPRSVSRYIADSRRRGWQRFFDGIRKDNDVAHVNDCAEDHDKTRLQSRSSATIGRPAGFIEVSTDLEGGVGIITALHGLTGRGEPKKSDHDNVILANVAPREGIGKRHENGTPFCYFFERKTGTLVVSTVDGYALSMAKKFGLTDHYFELDTRRALGILRSSGMITDEETDTTADTQFRSFEFSPSVAAYILRYGHMKSAETRKSISDIPDAPHGSVWHVDQFAKYGNTKTTLLPEDVFASDIVSVLKHDPERQFSKKVVTTLTTRFGVLQVYRRLKDVPEDGKPSVIVGSSGLDDRRFLEIVIQGGNAGRALGLRVGDSIF